jgi:hypothetical protein
MQHYDRSTISETPIETCEQCRLKPCEVCAHPETPHVVIHQRPKRAPVMDADQLQRDAIQDSGYAHRFSLRRLK